MKIFRDLQLDLSGTKKKIYFGKADNEKEIEEIYKLRYLVYSDKSYIESNKYSKGLEIDDYDRSGKCHYFIAKLDDKLIGCIRLIIDDPLPTEKYFSFSEPISIKNIQRNQRCELGRFIIIPPNKEKKEFLPRGIVMLFLLDTLSYFGLSNGLLGGYSFIKKSLESKFVKLRLPIGTISQYTQNYPKDGVLFNYFTQPLDPVLPIYFMTNEFYAYTEKNIHNSWMFKKISDVSFELKHNLYTEFLKKLNII